ncbi:MAG: type II secretion system protein [Desulfobacteraceae bacterium]|nr:type II secretion system protein [Desulfobacteraceae bacterium]
MKQKRSKHLNNKGFTLLEILVGVAIIGIVLTMAAPGFKNARTSSKAVALQSAADKIYEHWRFFCEEAGIPMNPTDGNAAILDDNSAMDVLIRGEGLEDDYTNAYERSGLQPMTRMATYDGSAESFDVQGFLVELTVDGDDFLVTYSDVPTEMVEVVWQKNFSSDFNKDSAITSGNVQYTEDADGVHDLVFARRI